MKRNEKEKGKKKIKMTLKLFTTECWTGEAGRRGRRRIK